MVGNLHNAGSIAVTLAGIIDFQLHAKVPAALPIELRLWLVVVIVDTTVFLATAVAGIAPGLVIIVRFIVGIIGQKHSPTVFAVCVISVVAALTQGRVTVTGIVISPDPFPAPMAADRFCLQAGFAKQCIIKFR